MKSLNIAVNKPAISHSIKDTLLEKNIWTAKELGMSSNTSHCMYILNFSKIKPDWLNYAVKQFVLYQASSRSFGTCRSYINSLFHFGQFVKMHDINHNHISRMVALKFITYVNQSNLKPATKNVTIINLRTFIEIMAREEWLPFPKERIIFDSDFVSMPNPIPRFIPESVMTQFQKHLSSLPDHFRRLIYILQETGRRISEICTLKFDCLTQDASGDYFLFIEETKIKKSNMIPITEECAASIKEQQQLVRHRNLTKHGYLFVSEARVGPPHAKARTIHKVLNVLAKNKNITGPSGEIWKFSAHQFRHTVGTRMINAGVAQPIIQRFLGHESPNMTNRYAYIHDSTLKEAFHKFQGTLINIQGKSICETTKQLMEEQWLKHNIMAQALPNGFCGLPLVQQRCPHANACLTCSNFRTDITFLPNHEKQLDETKNILKVASDNGWHRQIEMNQEVKINLETIIATLKGKKL